jgi:hypothetical protein
MSESAYFEYALVLPEEHYLIEVIGEGHEDVVKELKPNSISESDAQMLTRVQQLLTGPDTEHWSRRSDLLKRARAKGANAGSGTHPFRHLRLVPTVDKDFLPGLTR